MPGSYPDPRVCIGTALQAMEQAYEKSDDPDVGSLIIKAIEAIKGLKQNLGGSGASDAGDPYDWNELNSAI